MRVLFVGNGYGKFAGLRHTNGDTRLVNGLIRNGHYVFFFSDRDEARNASPFGLKAIGRKRTNEKLLKVVKNFQPEAIIVSHVDIIDPETLQEARSICPGLRIAQVNIDPLFNLKNLGNLRRRQNVVDATFITSGGTALNQVGTEKNTCYFIPNFTDSSIDTGTAFAHAETKYDLACFMHVNMERPDDEDERLSLTNGVAAAIPDLRTCYGGFNGLPPVSGRTYIENLSNSAMGLSLSKHTSGSNASTPETRYIYSSDRVSHVMGNGCLAFIKDDFGLQDIYATDEVAFFHDLAELTDKVRFYKNNPAARQAVAKKGWQKAHQEFNCTHVTQYMLERMMGLPLSHAYAWPLEGYRGPGLPPVHAETASVRKLKQTA